jgi:hypothetical protein
MAPYDDNPDTWADLDWRNIYDPDGRSLVLPPQASRPLAWSQPQSSSTPTIFDQGPYRTLADVSYRGIGAAFAS